MTVISEVYKIQAWFNGGGTTLDWHDISTSAFKSDKIKEDYTKSNYCVNMPKFSKYVNKKIKGYTPNFGFLSDQWAFLEKKIAIDCMKALRIYSEYKLRVVKETRIHVLEEC